MSAITDAHDPSVGEDADTSPFVGEGGMVAAPDRDAYIQQMANDTGLPFLHESPASGFTPGLGEPLRLPFDNIYARLPDRFYARLPPTPVAAPRLIKLNTALAAELGLDAEALASPAGRGRPGGQPASHRVRSRSRWPMPATSSATSCRSWATAAPSCWARSWDRTASAATSS